jgi:hypothetical protein
MTLNTVPGSTTSALLDLLSSDSFSLQPMMRFLSLKDLGFMGGMCKATSSLIHANVSVYSIDFFQKLENCFSQRADELLLTEELSITQEARKSLGALKQTKTDHYKNCKGVFEQALSRMKIPFTSDWALPISITQRVFDRSYEEGLQGIREAICKFYPHIRLPEESKSFLEWVNQKDNPDLDEIEVLNCNYEITGIKLKIIPDIIKNFVHPRYFLCKGNPVKFLPEMPQSLKHLNCSETLVKSLDVSVVDLIHLYCGYTLIDSLNLQPHPRLISLHVEDTPIESLALSCISNLQYLNCMKTKISTLELAHVQKLVTLDCSGTQVSSLELSSVPYLSYLCCVDTPIVSLNIASLESLTDLICDKTVQIQGNAHPNRSFARSTR